MAPLEIRPIVIYSLVFCVIVLALFFYHFRSNLSALGASLRVPILKHLVYRPAIGSRRFQVQWTRADVLAELAYLGLNVFCVYFKSPTLSSAGLRAANLCIVNLVFLCATPHLDTLTNTLGLQWCTVRRFHGSVGVMATLLLGFHLVAFAVSPVSFPVWKAENKWAVVAATSIGLLVTLCLPAIRNSWYELFLRVHQGLAILSVYAIWVHIAQRPLLPRFYLYTLAGGAGLSTLVLGCLIWRRNGILSYRLPRADVMNSKGAVLVRVVLSRPVRVRAGQYISLWLFMPSTSFHSLFEYHPFMVASWSDAPLATLDLLIEPRGGLTRHLLHRSQMRQDLCRAFFSGPHGNSVPVGQYEVVLMVASGYGIAAQLPYLKQLLHEYNSRKARSRRIHLVWELKTLDLAMAIESLLNDALRDDTLDNGYISVYVEDVQRSDKISSRAEVIKGLPDWYSIVKDEVAGKYIKRVQEEASTRGDMVVTGKCLLLTLLTKRLTVIVATSTGIRQELRAIVQRFVDNKVDLVELDYQPS
ncbi:hypothetical protein HIM_09824 [Hirsutella minnesotensis 3608]|uniref:ferric-chelate reductase (NADPH) n=1 Tax=Hirsutella minnesotensis 3608 TaxID=1043627 RepID=A0A0F8A2W2_9HYPO|nr:hypothetical protein HIM_09824 [Hirsutella minnesotensis 3608]